MTTRHRLAEKDKVALTATCSICGPGVKIAKNGKYGFACVVGRREAKKRWAKTHPEKARANRRQQPSQHRLEVRDGSTDRCRICGIVEPVAWGRGWMCPTRATELNRTPAEAPTPKCPRCLAMYVTAEGTCPACDDRGAVDLGYMLKIDEIQRRADRRNPTLQRLLADEAGGEEDALALGLSIVEGEYSLSGDTESAVPGWKTLGSAEPWHGVKPEYAKLYGAGRKVGTS